MVGDGKRCAGLSAEGPNGRKIVDNQPDYTEMHNRLEKGGNITVITEIACWSD